MVVDAGDHLAFPTIRERDPTDQVELPQVHRRVPLPATVLTRMLLLLRGGQPITNEYAVHRRPRRHRLEQLLNGDLVDDAPGTPPRMLLTQLADQRLDCGQLSGYSLKCRVEYG
ncbi:hypothetical protein GCM10012284_53420 [Mangrovihabitans endophyticus]|uniref:Uncharacterized protein n=1 Tax=Mangrovihabitans endophyticus TaxID=1751298 RepID=A0A8J3C365_9ACTN|nr:hypothetical protein GCM10012284_53420 [Mangrovihabitans endophyticus]